MSSKSISKIKYYYFKKTYKEWLEAVRINGYVLDSLPDYLRNPELCLMAVKQNGHVLEQVPEALKTHEICLIAVKQHGMALKHVPEELKTAEICYESIKNGNYILRDIPKEIRDGHKLLTEQEIIEKHSREELLTSSNTYLRRLGVSNGKE